MRIRSTGYNQSDGFNLEKFQEAHLKSGEDPAVGIPRLYLEWKKLRRKQSVGKSRAKIRPVLFRRQQGLCFWCAQPLVEGEWQIDHHVPRCFGGHDALDNKRALCFRCNSRKSTLLPEDFALLMSQDLI